MGEYYTLDEAREILHFADEPKKGCEQLRRCGIHPLRTVFDKEEIDQLAEDLLEAEEIPDGYITLIELAKLFPQLTDGYTSKILPSTKLLLRVRELKDIGVLFRTKGTLTAKKLYPKEQAMELCEDMILDHEPPEGFYDSKQVCRILGLQLSNKNAETVKLFAKKHKTKLMFITQGLWNAGGGSKYTFFRAKDVEKLKKKLNETEYNGEDFYSKASV